MISSVEVSEDGEYATITSESVIYDPGTGAERTFIAHSVIWCKGTAFVLEQGDWIFEKR